MSYFNTEQKKLINKMRVYQDEVADCDLRDEPCPLLIAQLEELLTLTTRLSANAKVLLATIKKDQS